MKKICKIIIVVIICLCCIHITPAKANDMYDKDFSGSRGLIQILCEPFIFIYNTVQKITLRAYYSKEVSISVICNDKCNKIHDIHKEECIESCKKKYITQ